MRHSSNSTVTTCAPGPPGRSYLGRWNTALVTCGGLREQTSQPDGVTVASSQLPLPPAGQSFPGLPPNPATMALTSHRLQEGFWNPQFLDDQTPKPITRCTKSVSTKNKSPQPRPLPTDHKQLRHRSCSRSAPLKPILEPTYSEPFPPQKNNIKLFPLLVGSKSKGSFISSLSSSSSSLSVCSASSASPEQFWSQYQRPPPSPPSNYALYSEVWKGALSSL